MGQGEALANICVPWPNSTTRDFQFNVSCAECRLCVAEDGTQVDDDEYLATLPPQTLFILLKDKEKMVTGMPEIAISYRGHKVSKLKKKKKH